LSVDHHLPDDGGAQAQAVLHTLTAHPPREFTLLGVSGQTPDASA
jgi:hypothetical protein